jgi:hypothetical protein
MASNKLACCGTSILEIFLIDQGFKTNEVCPHSFIKRIHAWLVVVVVYVDDLNLINMVDAISFFNSKVILR